MCGIFGFISKDGQGPNIHRLKSIAWITQSRGRHAFGLAWEDDGGIATFKRPGSAGLRIRDLDRVRGSQAVIGHCRWATSGLPEDNANNHPHPAGKGMLVHNGQVGNYHRLVNRFGLDIQTECDSEALGLLMKRAAGSILDRAKFMRAEAVGTMAMLGLWVNPIRMLILRSGRPVHFGEDRHGFYFASLAPQLPGKVYALRNNKAYLLSPDGGNLYMESKVL